MNTVILNWRDSTHPEAGGAELYCQSVARELVRLGEEVTYVTARSTGTRRRERLDGYTIVRRGGRYTVYLAVLWYLLIHRRRIDAVIDSQNGIPFFSPAVLPKRTPIVLLMHHVHQEQFALYFPAPIAALGRWLESSVARRIYSRRAIAAVSPSTRAAVRTQLRLRGPIRLAPCGLEPPSNAPRVRAENPRIVTVGRLVPHKQVNLLIEAMPEIRRQIPSCELEIIGDGAERGALEGLALSLGLQEAVTFHGRVSDTERDRLLSSAWLTVNPTRGEGWGLSVLEANRLGVPAVAFRVDGLRDSVVHDVTGWLVGENDSLAQTVANSLSSLADAQFERQIDSAVRAWASSFTWENTTGALLNVLSEERSALSRSEDRRGRNSDLMTIVEVPNTAVPVNWAPALRLGDIVQSDISGYRLLLASADHMEIPNLLLRLGVVPNAVASGEVHVSVAGQQETLLLAAGMGQASTRGADSPYDRN